MLTGSPPFTAKTGGQKELDRKIMSEKLSCPPYLTAQAHKILKGMLEKDPGKRLGCVKGTMFKVGGVAALKSHVFFEGIEWEYLLQKDHGPPPIDLSPEGAEHEGGGGDAAGTDDTSHFHEGFTSQSLTPSVVEDSLTPCHSVSGTPSSTPCRSRSTSFDYEGFSYSEPGELMVTHRDVLLFEENLQVQIRNQRKKDAKKAKKEEVRIAKELVEREKAAERAAEVEREQVRMKKELEDRNAEEQKRKTVEKLKKVVEENESMLTLAREEHDAVVAASEERRKKVKRFTKKLKEVEQLEEKQKQGGVLSKEQLKKLERRQELEDDLIEAEVRSHLLHILHLLLDCTPPFDI